MFSGLTNQVSSWMGAAKGEPQDEEVPTPTREAIAEAAASADPEKQSPTKGGSKLDLITNVKSQMTGWLGSGIPIPGLRKGGDAASAGEPGATGSTGTELPAQPEEQPAKDDDDNSRYNSATGGADSRPATPGGTPTEDQPQGVGNGDDSQLYFSAENSPVPDVQGYVVCQSSPCTHPPAPRPADHGKFEYLPMVRGTRGAYKANSDRQVTTKAVAGAKSLGNFLYSAVNKAGAKVSEASAKIKKTVEENSILGEFNREQEAFIKGQEKGGAAAVAPWVGAPNEAALKEECLSLSTDRRNFVRAPPAGVEFEFDYDKMYPVAVAIMQEDPNLEKMRFEIVPKVITEENFWRNYFYRVSLICQANEADAAGRQLSTDDSQEEKSSSDSIQGAIADVKQRISSLKVDRENANDDEQWEKELEAELKEYEVVADGTPGGNAGGAGWEKECDELLSDELDLK